MIYRSKNDSTEQSSEKVLSQSEPRARSSKARACFGPVLFILDENWIYLNTSEDTTLGSA